MRPSLPILLFLLSAPALAASAQDGTPVTPDVQKQIDAVRAESEARYQTLLEEMDAWKRSAAGLRTAPPWTERLTLGGYGEIHFNSEEGRGKEQIDLHRLVAYFGYRFEDWIQLHSEVEIEHGLAAPDADGEVAVEQLHVDFLCRGGINFRVGRFLTPLGIVNETHEPTTFNGVERPDFDTFVIPTTWSTDGAGIFGRFSEDVKYELYLGSSLDGTGFDPVEGIREGRQEDRAGVTEPAISGRLDWYPAGAAGDLRLGASFFGGGLDNGPEGVNPGIDADLEVYSADFQYSPGKWDFRGVYAFEKINGAADIGGGVASEIDGFYVEAARHILPESCKTGRLEKADLVAFARYDVIDTQKDLPSGAVRDPAGERDVLTVGLSFFPTNGLVLKTDYQISDDDSSSGLPERFNLGVGWSF
jgi:hypothetical protein